MTMKENAQMDFNLENALKVLKAFKEGFEVELRISSARNALAGKQPDKTEIGMLKAVSLSVGIFTDETDFRKAIEFLNKKGVTIK